MESSNKASVQNMFGFWCSICSEQNRSVRLQPGLSGCKLCSGQVTNYSWPPIRNPTFSTHFPEDQTPRRRKRIAGIYNVGANPKKPQIVPEKKPEHLRLVCMSDTHSLHGHFTSTVPKGDIFIHCGDFTVNGGQEETENFIEWLDALEFQHKIVIGGNHEASLDEKMYAEHWWRFHEERADASALKARLKSVCTYLEDEIVDVAGLRVAGSPWVRQYHHWAFNLPDAERSALWQSLPAGVDLLLTHSPPSESLGFLSNQQDHGCNLLKAAVDRVQPLIHLFGHVHEGYGVKRKKPTTFVNCSSVTQTKKPINKPIVIDLEDVPVRPPSNKTQD